MLSEDPLPEPFQNAVNAFQEKVNAKLESQQKADGVEQPLYQYTTAAGLKGIFETEQLWFTDYRFHNDPGEFLYGQELALEVLDTFAAAAPNKYAKQLIESVRSILTSDQLDTAIDMLLACFTRKRDDLGQWRAYGDNGRGFAIGFAPPMFAIEDPAFKKHIDKIFLGSVVYDETDALSRHREAIGWALDEFLEAARSYPHLMKLSMNRDAFIKEMRISLIAQPLIWYSLTTKHHAYRDEDEVRQVLLGAGDDLRPDIKTRVRGSEIVPYVAVPWLVRAKGMIEEIVVGPAASLGAEEAVIAMLRYYGVDGVKVTCSRSCGVDGVKVTRSKIPYRPV
jgi:hypothetical protein